MKKIIYIALLLLSVSITAQITVRKKLKITDTPNTSLPSEILVKTTGDNLVKATTFSQLVALMQSNLTFTVNSNTQLSQAQVGVFATSEGFIKGAHTVDTNTQLSNAQVSTAALSEGFVKGAHTVDTNTQLSNTQVGTAALAEGFVKGAHTTNTNTQLSQSQVGVFATNLGFAKTAINNNFSVHQNFAQDVTIGGALVVNGGTFQVNSEITTTDAVLDMNSGEVGNGVTSGFSGLNIDRGSSTNFAFGFDEIRDSFVLGKVTDLSAPNVATMIDVAARAPTANWTSGRLPFWNGTSKLFEDSGIPATSVWHTGNLTLASLGYTGANNANYITNNNQLTNGAGYITSYINTNTQLSNAQVGTAALAEGFIKGAHTVDTNTQLSQSQVGVFATSEGFVKGAHTVDTNTQLSNTQVGTAALAEGFVKGVHTPAVDLSTYWHSGNSGDAAYSWAANSITANGIIVGGGYGITGTGATIGSNGNINTNGALYVANSITASGNITANGGSQVWDASNLNGLGFSFLANSITANGNITANGGSQVWDASNLNGLGFSFLANSITANGNITANGGSQVWDASNLNGLGFSFLANSITASDNITANGGSQVWDASNLNLSTVDFAAKDVIADEGHLGVIKISSNEINTSSSAIYINYKDFAGTFNNFKNFVVADGKGGNILNLTGSTKAALFSGSVTSSTGMVAPNFVIGSDRRLKTNIIPISQEEIHINYKQFERKDNLGQLRYGVIAQELELGNPELVYTDKETGMKGVAYTDLLIREIAFLKAQNEIKSKQIEDILTALSKNSKH